VISKIVKASVEVGALSPDKTNTAQNYSYISADKILERAGNALSANGVAVIPAITEESTTQVDYTDSYGKAKMRFDAVIRFTMTLTDGETQMDMAWCGRGTDFASPDKALYKAITSGHKYFLAKLLNIGIGNEDGEHEEEPAQDNTKASRQGQATRPQAAQKAQGATTTPQRTVDASTGEITVSDVPTDAELEILGTWLTPLDAQAWAVKNGACGNEFEARTSFAKVVDAHGGKLTKENIAVVYLDYLRKQNRKLEERKVAA
jgi:hypothetical protein